MKHIVKSVFTPYAVTIFQFLGVAFIAGALSHGFLDWQRNLAMGFIGGFLFLCGALLDELIIKKTNFSNESRWYSVRIILISFAFSLGVGMLSGGIQHYLDSPYITSFLIPLGILLSIMMFIIKEDVYLGVHEYRKIWFIMCGLCIVLFVILYGIAGSIATIGHGH